MTLVMKKTEELCIYNNYCYCNCNYTHQNYYYTILLIWTRFVFIDLVYSGFSIYDKRCPAEVLSYIDRNKNMVYFIFIEIFCIFDPQLFVVCLGTELSPTQFKNVIIWYLMLPILGIRFVFRQPNDWRDQIFFNCKMTKEYY